MFYLIMILMFVVFIAGLIAARYNKFKVAFILLAIFILLMCLTQKI